MKKIVHDMGFKSDNTKPFYFISYNRQDIERVRSITKSLHSKGVHLWYDKGIDYGTKWKHVIGERIAESEAILMFVSYDLLNRDDSYVEKEYTIARNIDKKLLIVLLDDIDQTKILAKNYVFFAELMEHNVINAFEMDKGYLVQQIISSIDYQITESESEKSEMPAEKQTTESKAITNEETAVTNGLVQTNDSHIKKNANPLKNKYFLMFIKVLNILLIIFGALFILVLILIYAK